MFLQMLDIHEEIQSAISKPISDDNDELEEELAELMRTDDAGKPNNNASGDLEEQLAKLDIKDLPDVSTPNMSLREASIN